MGAVLNTNMNSKIDEVMKAIDRCVDAWLQEEKLNYIKEHGNHEENSTWGHKTIEPELFHWKKLSWPSNYCNLRILMDWKKQLEKERCGRYYERNDPDWLDRLMFGLNDLIETYKKNEDLLLLWDYGLNLNS